MGKKKETNFLHWCSWQESLGDFHGRNSLYREIHQRTVSDQNGGSNGYGAATWTKQCLKPPSSYPRGPKITEGWKTWVAVVSKHLLKTAFKGSLADTIWEKALGEFQTRELDVCAEQISRSYKKEKINWHAVTSHYWGRVIMAFIKGCCASQSFFEGVNKRVNSGPCGFPKGFQKGSHQ